MRTLLFSTLYPSSARPGHGIFVETRLHHLLAHGGVEAKVLAPVPWFPSAAERFGVYGQMARTPRREQWNGIDVLHPRYPLIPKVGMTLAPLMLAAACLRPIRRLIEAGFDFDVLDAHYYYPDGVAAAWLGQRLGKPVTITARGSDLNLIGRDAAARRMMVWAALRANASIGVCQALVDVLDGWQVPRERLHVMRNGVDLQRFRLQPRAELRARLGQSAAPLLLSVGHLVELKGHDLVIRALGDLRRTHPQAKLAVIGDGAELRNLQQCARDAGVSDHVRFTGALPQAALADWYGAADVLVLASSREGWANVLLEAMACGTPVVATRTGGTPEVVAAPEAGRLADERSVAAIARALTDLLAAPPARERVRAYAEGFSWEATSRQQLALFRGLAGSAAGG